MPWCEDCAKFWNPNSMPPDGSCPSCGAVIAEPPSQSVPWHFWVLIVGVVVYLGWRYVQLFQWLVRNDKSVIAIILGVVTAVLVAWLVIWLVRREPSDGDVDVDADVDVVDDAD